MNDSTFEKPPSIWYGLKRPASPGRAKTAPAANAAPTSSASVGQRRARALGGRDAPEPVPSDIGVSPFVRSKMRGAYTSRRLPDGVQRAAVRGRHLAMAVTACPDGAGNSDAGSTAVRPRDSSTRTAGPAVPIPAPARTSSRGPTATVARPDSTVDNPPAWTSTSARPPPTSSETRATRPSAGATTGVPAAGAYLPAVRNSQAPVASSRAP